MNTLLRPKTARAFPPELTRKSTASLLLVSLLLTAFAAQAAASSDLAPRKKRVVALKRTETPDGARFTLTSDSALDDYKSYAEGERLFVLVPLASLSSARGALARGRGFADLRLEEREDGLLISFLLQTGATVAVSQNFNRLELVFIVNEPASRPRLA